MKKFVLGSSLLLSLCLSSCGFLDLLPHTSNSEGTSTTSETTSTTSEGTSTTSTTSEGTSTTSEDTSTTSTTSEGTSSTSETSTTSEESTTSETSISSEESTSSESPSSESSSEESTSESSSEESTSESTSEEYKPSKLTPTVTYKTYTEQNAYYSTYCPQTGNPKLLVIPVWFTDSSTYITSTTRKNNVKNDIETAYFGTTSATGWHSVKSYYETDSFNKVSLSGTVSDWYECGQASTYYYTDGNKTIALLTDAVTWYKESQGLSNLKSFDSNSDGYIDGVMLIYAAPDYQAMGSSSASNMWAYCTSNGNRGGTVDDPQGNIFFWASYDFMYSSTKASSRAGTNYGNGDTSHCTVDAHTFIHEMGHVFGLLDYYDYGNATKPTGGFSMQDMNVGAHDPYSRYSLGWATPYVPTQTCTFTVKPIESSGEFVLLSPSYSGSAFDEYILLELYSPTGLNELDCTYAYSGNYPKGPNVAGVRVWHIDARLYDITSITSQGTIGGGNVTSFPPNRGYYDDQHVPHYGVVHATGNSSTGERVISYAGSTLYRENYLVRNNTTTTYSNNNYISSSDLFKTGDTFTISKYKSQFPGSTKFNNGNSFNWSVSFDSVTSSGMTITCTLN